MAIAECRACGNRSLLPVLDLGSQALTGIFPRDRDEEVPVAPLELVRCSPEGCGLVQLRHTADPSLMYGDSYGYRSGIRPFMINHLKGKVEAVRRLVDLDASDLVLDIGSNDSTLLRHYPDNGPQLVGIDPTGEKWRPYYPQHVDLIADFFSKEAFGARYGDRKAKVITSIAMFYDLPDPLQFMRDVHAVLADDGVWMLELSYLPSMLAATAYDVICHEHLEYYALRPIEWMAEQVGLKVIRAEVTDVYGGSLCLTLAKSSAGHQVDEVEIERLRKQEEALGLDTTAPYEAFATRVREHRDELRGFLADSKAAGKLTLGYGASTKGNVVLQYCGLDESDLPCIGEVSPEKSGRFTPGTRIPIVSEQEALSQKPDQLLVLPWVYRDGYVEREQDFLAGGGKLVFPLPAPLSIV
ncbi:class I SAM-dependent methyltransferase [Streptomyces sp. BPTC-684]|uniref:class I SAM-dependent methyltransferase n=1 Tax=Streptomyces sp. BPTC-684 TaxID=3043734 RepID=UPI0024B1E1BC|nr:class I SAM-dependent methyltransferase [Streptomyces sp. BPTC-684]WHM36510.1 class I SAM-dependent methyltransferase [Streptomyces sp. BPTC-684]